MISKENTIGLLRHTRHDWLNRIQIIKGNLELGKPDRALEIIGQIIEESINETQLSNLNLPLFSEFLLTYNWNNQPLIIKFEVKGTPKQVVVDDEYLYKKTNEIVELLLSTLDMSEENVLMITIDLEEETRFYYDFRGKLKDIDLVSKYFNECVEPSFQNVYFDEEELSIQLL